MAKTSRKRKRAKARNGKGPAGKSSHKPASDTPKQPHAKTGSEAAKSGKPARPGKAKPAAPTQSGAPAPKGKKKPAAAQPKEAAKDTSKSGFFSKLKGAFATEGQKKPARTESPRPTPSRTWYDEPDLDRFAALDPANRKKTKLPPKMERPSPLHLDEAAPRTLVADDSNQRIRLEDPVLEPRPDGQPVRLNPEDEVTGNEEPVKLTDAFLADAASRAMPAGNGDADPFVLGIDNDLPTGTDEDQAPATNGRQAGA